MYFNALILQWGFLKEHNAPDELKREVANDICNFYQQNEINELKVDLTENNKKVIKEAQAFLMKEKDNK